MAPTPEDGGAAERVRAHRLRLRRSVRAAVLLVAGLVAPVPARAAASIEQLEATLDALIAHQLPSHGWTFGTHAGARPEPATYVMGLAERVAAPVGLAQWDLVVLRSPGTPAAGLVLLGGYRLTGRPEYLAAARAAGDLLVEIQLSTGGWFSEMPGHLLAALAPEPPAPCHVGDPRTASAR